MTDPMSDTAKSGLGKPIDQYSIATVPLVMRFNDTKLATGTGFIWQHRHSYYLITNWHNVSGRDPNTDRHLLSTAAEPNNLVAMFNSRGNLGERHPIKLRLRDHDGNVDWLVHPTLKRKVDVVAIPLQGPVSETIEFHPINKMPSTDIVPAVAMDVFVLGYPFGAGTTRFPIWKRGSIASEPHLFPEHDAFYSIDTASRPGMSGSPVIIRTSGPFQTADGRSVMSSAPPATKFLGVYSGRLPSQDSLEAQIGIVWPAPYIDEIIRRDLNQHG